MMVVAPTATVYHPQMYAQVPMQYRPRNTCCRVFCIFVAPVVLLLVGLGVIGGGIAVDVDGYWVGCG